MAAERTIWDRQGFWKGGKRMLNGGDMPYLFRKDGPELDRLNDQHFRLKDIMGGHSYCAPVKHPRMILDVASGTGIWGREMAEHFKGATVWNIDTDAAPYEEGKKTINFPPRWRFKPWTYPAPIPFEGPLFDYVHARFLAVVVPVTGWSALLQDMQRVTRPGGWIGLLEGGMYQTTSQTANLLTQAAATLMRAGGLEPNAGPRLVEWARAAGLTAIKHKQLDEGKAEREHERLIASICASAASAKERLIQAGFFSKEDMADLQHDLPLELKAVGVSMTYHAVWGQKPA